MEYVETYEKITTWIKTTLGVSNVNSKQEAIKKVIHYYEQKKDPIYEEDIEVVDSELMYELAEPISVEENGGATIEVMDKHTVVWDNGKVR